MDRRLEIRQVKSNYEVNYYEGRKGKATYHNILNADAAKIAAILIDLEITSSLPIFEGIKEYLRRRDAKDWLGL